MQSILNVRMDSVLKERGDKVLSEHGVSVSAAVRALWTQLANTRELPDFLKQANDEEQERKKKLDALERLASIGQAIRQQSSEDFDYESLIDQMYDDMWKKYEALK